MSYEWSRAGASEIPAAAGMHPIAFRVLADGTAMGMMMSATEHRGFVWSPADGTVVTPDAGGLSFERVDAGNDVGDFVGRVVDADGNARAAIWSRSGGGAVLPVLGTGESHPRAINDAGQVVGSSGAPMFESYPYDPAAPLGQNHAVLWVGGAVIDVTPGHPWSEACDINSGGTTVGSYSQENEPGSGALVSSAFSWTAAGGLVTLAGLGGDTAAEALNDAGVIVGSSSAQYGGPSRAVMWVDGSVRDLNDLLPSGSGWVLQDATDVNDLGQVIGYGTYQGENVPFLLTPDGLAGVPEPGCGVVVVVTGVGATALRRRRTTV